MIERLHYITQGDIEGFSHPQLAEIACRSGVKWVQLRIKDETFEDYLNAALATKVVCDKYGAKIIINDNVTIAKEIKANGVHLGKEDMDPEEAREILGNQFIIGATANTFNDIIALNRKGVDYVGLGPYRFTTTKKKLSPVLGLEGYKSVMTSVKKLGIQIPVIAIGGIQHDDIKNILNTGVYGVALASVINKARDKATVIQKLLKELNHGEIAHSR